MWMLMGSEKSPLNSSDSSCAKAFLAMTNTVIVSKYSQQVTGQQYPTFECLLDIDGFLGAGLEVRDPTFGLTKSHGAF
jgi:hypothetical protein